MITIRISKSQHRYGYKFVKAPQLTMKLVDPLDLIALAESTYCEIRYPDNVHICDDHEIVVEWKD